MNVSVVALALNICLTAAVGGNGLGQSHPDLTTRSKSVAIVGEGQDIDPTDQFWWISDEELVVCRSPWPREVRKSPEADFRRINLKTGTETPLIELTLLFRETSGTPSVIPSPDGRHIIWSSPFSPDMPGKWHHSRIDGSQYVSWEGAFSGGVHWSGDSSEWTEVTAGEPEVKYVPPRLTAAQSAIFCVRNLAKPSEPLKHTLRITGTVDAFDCTMSPGGHAIKFSWDKGSRAGAQDIVDINLSMPPDGAPKTYVVDLPKHQLVPEAHLNPSCTRVAWVLTYSINDAPGNQEETMQGIWVSDLDGSNMREIGSVRRSPAFEVPIVASMIRRLMWMPGGKTLSYVREGRLWTVNVDDVPGHK